MTIATERPARTASPTDLDLRRQLREARDEVRALREQLQSLASDLTVAEHRRVEMHVAYVELLVHARAEVAEARCGTGCRRGYLAGHLEEIGLEPPSDTGPDQIVAEGLALAEQLAGGAS